MKAPAFTLLALLAGCTAFNAGDPAALRATTNDQLCGSYAHDAYRKHFPAIRAEIERRRLVEPHEWPVIAERKVRVDMGRCALLASWGHPSRINQASYGNQWVYCRDGANCFRRQYVYVRGDRVTAWN